MSTAIEGPQTSADVSSKAIRQGRKSRQWRAILLSVFADESHDETSARVFAVAGLFGNESQWDYLNEKWLGCTQGKIFHATECDTDQGDFSETTHAENKKLYKD